VIYRVGIFASLLFFATFAGYLLYQSRKGKAQPSDSPIICREAVWDFGSLKVDSSKRLTHHFELENLSDQQVRIEKVITDCGCVVAEKHPAELSPGSPLNLPVDVTVAGPPGPFQKHVHVVLATSPLSKVTLTIRGLVAPNPAFYLVPSKLNFGTLADNETAIRTIKIARFDSSSIEFLRATSRSDALQIKKVQRGNERDSFIEMTLSLDVSRLSPGDFSSSVDVSTDHPEHPDVKIPVHARIAAVPRGIPESIFVGHLARGASVDKRLANGECPPPQFEGVRYIGAGPICVEFIGGRDRSVDRASATVRFSCRNESTGSSLVRGELIAELIGRKKPVRIPLTVLVTD
jgi:hypothetical protein